MPGPNPFKKVQFLGFAALRVPPPFYLSPFFLRSGLPFTWSAFGGGSFGRLISRYPRNTSAGRVTGQMNDANPRPGCKYSYKFESRRALQTRSKSKGGVLKLKKRLFFKQTHNQKSRWERDGRPASHPDIECHGSLGHPWHPLKRAGVSRNKKSVRRKKLPR